MNSPRPLLAASLALNAGLLAAVLFWSPADSKLNSTPRVEATTPALAVDATRGLAAKNAATPAPNPATAWEQLRTGDLTTLAARLRAAGFSPTMIRAIVRTLVSERFAERRRQIAAGYEKPYWQGRDSSPDAKSMAELNALSREERDLLRQCLGADENNSAEDQRMAMLRQFGREISPETWQQVQSLQRVFAEHASEVRAGVGSQPRPSDFDKIRELQRGLHDDLAKILTPEELFEYDLRNDGLTTSILRFRLSALQPTEAEFRALYPLYRSLEAQFPIHLGSGPLEGDSSREAAELTLQDQIKAALGPERFAEFELARDYNYQQVAKITERLGLPPAITREVYTFQQEAQQQAAALRANRTLSAEDRAAQLAALAGDVSGKVSAVLGASGLEAYKQYAGQWMQQLQPRPRPNAKTP